MYRSHGFQDKDLLLETLVKDDVMTFFPEFNLLVASSSYDPSEGLYARTTAVFNARPSEIASGEFFKDCEFVYDTVFYGGQDKAIAIFDAFERDADGGYSYDPRLLMLANLFSWSPTNDVDSIPDLVDAAANYQEYQLSDQEGFEQSHGKPASEVHVGKSHSDAKELLDKLTSSETVS